MTYAKNRVPEGFSIDGEWENDTIIIRHNRIGMRAMNVFLILFFAVWTFASIKVIGVYWDEKIHGGQVVFFWAAEILIAIFLAYLLFCNKIFQLSPNRLIVRTKVLWYENIKTIHKLSISAFAQIKDGGDSDDSFPSWGLEVEGDSKLVLLYRQGYEQSYWLGNVFAEWFNVEFYKYTE